MTDVPPARGSALGRLLQELSWVGANIRDYRSGGLGFENVLTAEVLTGLDYLPRTSFLGAVLAGATGADEARRQALEEVEQAELTLLPDDLVLRRPAGAPVVVQPDGILVSPSSYTLIEAKRIKRSSFRPEQLAREYATLLQEARGRTPLLLLLLGSPPPVSVVGEGRLGIQDAVARHLEKFAPSDELPRLLDRVSDVVAWTTWDQLRQVVERQAAAFGCDDDSLAGSVARLAAGVTDAVRRHSEPGASAEA